MEFIKIYLILKNYTIGALNIQILQIFNRPTLGKLMKFEIQNVKFLMIYLWPCFHN